MDLDILKLLETKELYNRYYHLINKDSVIESTWKVINDLKEYYNTNDTIEWETFSTWFRTIKHKTMKPETLDLYNTMFQRLKDMETADPDKLIVMAMKEREHATKISNIALSIIEDDTTLTLKDVEDALESYYKDIDRAKEIKSMFVTDDLDDIMNHVVGKGGVNWRLNELNISCGPIRKGDFVIIGARPDTGKTTLLAAEATHMATQLEETQDVLWFNNEEEGRKVKSRIYQAALEKEISWIDTNRQEAKERYETLLGRTDRIKLIDNKRMSIRDVEAVLKESEAGLIIFDQLWKIAGFEKEAVTETDRYTRLFAWAREIASDYAPVITVHQADASAHGVKFIEMNALYMSKTGMQGEADAIITLGRELGTGVGDNSRGLYVPKNKLAGGGISDEAYRNGKFEIEIQPTVARFKGAY